MASPSPPVALVTGTSSGIGRSTALLLARSGYRVFATVRTSEAEADLRRDAGGSPLDILRLDVGDEGSARLAARTTFERAGRIDVLVNNAGYAQVGAVADLTRDRVRRQFEVNVFAPVQLVREVLPVMRTQGGGRIVNVSSLAGRVSVPMMGAYCASKFALEAFSDALRIEAKPFGIHVSLIEPGPVVTEFQRNALAESRDILESESVYGSVYRSYLEGGFDLGRGATSDRVARVILRALRARRPRSRYRVRVRDSVATGFIQIVPRAGMDWVLSRWMELDLVRRA